MEQLRDRIKAERKRLKLTQGQLAELVDKTMGQSFISNLETGLREETPFIAELANALGVDAYWLKTGKGNRLGPCQELSEEEKLLLTAFPLLERDTRETWMWQAKKSIDAYEASKQNAEQPEFPPGVQENTSPAFPPVPQQASSGMDGIETATTADNVQGVSQ